MGRALRLPSPPLPPLPSSPLSLSQRRLSSTFSGMCMSVFGDERMDGVWDWDLVWHGTFWFKVVAFPQCLPPPALPEQGGGQAGLPLITCGCLSFLTLFSEVRGREAEGEAALARLLSLCMPDRTSRCSDHTHTAHTPTSLFPTCPHTPPPHTLPLPSCPLHLYPTPPTSLISIHLGVGSHRHGGLQSSTCAAYEGSVSPSQNSEKATGRRKHENNKHNVYENMKTHAHTWPLHTHARMGALPACCPDFLM